MCTLLYSVPPTLQQATADPHLRQRLLDTHASARDSWTPTGKSESVSCGVIAPFSWVLVCTSFCLYPPRIYFPSPVCSGSSMVELMKILATSFKRSHACTVLLNPPDPAAGHHQPCLCWRLLDAHRQVWVSLLWGQCSFLLGPDAHKILFVSSRSLFLRSCVSSGGFMVGLMAPSSKRAYAMPRSTAPRAPAPVAGCC